MAKRASRNQAAASAAPGTSAPEGKKEKKERIEFLTTLDTPEGAEGPAKLTYGDERLQSFDRKTHKPLKADDFVAKHHFMKYKADDFEAKAASLRSDAEKLEKLGDIADVKKAKRLIALQKQMADLTASLEADGQDIGALMEALGLSSNDDESAD